MGVPFQIPLAEPVVPLPKPPATKARFVDRWASYVGVAGGVSAENAKAAYVALFKAIPLEGGANVLVSSCSSPSVWEAMEELGLNPVVREPDPYTLLLDGTAMTADEWSRLDAVVVSHLYGRPAPLETLVASARKFGVFVIEDATQAHGAEYRGKKVGSFGDAAVFCFRPGRLLADEEGGAMVVSSLAPVLESARAANSHEFSKAANARLCARLTELDTELARRESVAQWYRERLGTLEGLRTVLPERQGRHVYYRFVLRVPEADAIQTMLADKGIETGKPRFFALTRPGSLPLAKAVEAETLFLPMGPSIDEAAVDKVFAALKEALLAVRA